MPTTLSPKTFKIDDARTEKLLQAIAAQRGNLLIDEGEFEDNYELEPFFTKALERKLIGFTPGGAQSTFYRVFLRPEGWMALGIERKTLLDRITNFLGLHR